MRNLITVKTKHGFLRLTPEEHRKRHLDRTIPEKPKKETKPKPEEPEGET